MGKLIRLSKSVVGDKEADALKRVVLEDGYLGMGQEVRYFEQEIKDFLGTDKEVICVNSGTAALHLAVMSVLNPGDEVLVQSLTYLGSFQAISAVGCIPVACEVNLKDLTIDLKDAAKRITKQTKAIMPVHYASRAGELDKIYKFAKEHKLRVIEDAAHAFGTMHSGKKVGSFGDIICFSFDGIKNITCAEGGALITADKKVSQFAKDARMLAVHRDTDMRYKGQRSWEFDVTSQGYRYHMSNLFAAIGRVQLKRFDSEFKSKRQNLAREYNKALNEIKEIELFFDEYDQVVPHIFVIKVLVNKRDSLRRYLSDNNIETGIHYYPNHLLTYYGGKKGFLPITEEIYNQVLSLPLHPDVSQEDQNRIINKIKEFFS